jgi:hypothetical protein
MRALRITVLLLGMLARPALGAVDDGSWVEARVRPAQASAASLVPVVRDDAAPAIVAALEPLAEGRVVADGWVLSGIELGRFVRLLMTRGDERLEAAVYPAGELLEPACTAGALGVVTQEVNADVARAACGALQGADAARLFSHVLAKPEGAVVQPGTAAEAPGLLARVAAWTHVAIVTQGVFLLLVVLTVAVGRRVARGRLTRGERRALLGVVLVAGVLRLALPEAAPFKEAYPWRSFGVITLPLPGLGVPSEPGMPVAHHAVVGLFWQVLWGGVHPEQVFFAVGRVLASLAPLVLALALAAWAPSGRGPLLAAWVLALLPLHVKYAASEAVTVPSTFYQAVALLALGAWATRPHPPIPPLPEGRGGGAAGLVSPARERGPGGEALLLLFVSLWMVFLVRPENPILAPLYPLGAFALASGGLVARLRAALPVLGVTALAVVPAALVLAQGGPAAGTASNFATEIPNLAGRLLPPHDVWLRPDLTPAWLPFVAAVGAAWLAWRRPGGLVVLLGGLGLLVPVYSAITSDVLPFGEGRYQVSLAPYWCGLAGFGLAALAGLPGLRGRSFVPAVLALGVAAGALPLVGLVRDAGYAPQDEFRFFRGEVRPRLEAAPPACPLLLVPTGEQRYKDAEGDDFVQLLRLPPGLLTLDRRGLEGLASRGALPPCALFYRGLYCYRARVGDEPQNPECEAILGSRGLLPVVETTVPNRQYHREVDPTPDQRATLTFGLYRVELPLVPR